MHAQTHACVHTHKYRNFIGQGKVSMHVHMRAHTHTNREEGRVGVGRVGEGRGEDGREEEGGMERRGERKIRKADTMNSGNMQRE